VVERWLASAGTRQTGAYQILLNKAKNVNLKCKYRTFLPTSKDLETRLTTTHFLMSSTSLLRIVARAQPCTFFRANGIRNVTLRSSSAVYAVPALIATSGSASSFSTSSRKASDPHAEESFEEFTARYVASN
jgi:hypothetical protein